MKNITIAILGLLVATAAWADTCPPSRKVFSSNPQGSIRFGERIETTAQYAVIGNHRHTVQLDLMTGDFIRDFSIPDSTSLLLGLRGVGDSGVVLGKVGAETSELIVRDLDTGLEVFSVDRPDSLWPESSTPQFGSAAALSGNLLLTYGFGFPAPSETRKLFVYDTLSGQTVRLWETDVVGSFGALALTATRAIVRTSDDPDFPGAGVVRVMNIASGDTLYSLHSPSPEYLDWFGRDLAVADGYLVVSEEKASANGRASVHVYDLETGALLRTIELPEFCPDSYSLLDHRVDVRDGLLVASLSIEALDYHATCQAPGAVFLFDIATGDLVREVISPEPELYNRYGSDVALGGGRLLVGAMGDGTNGVDNGAVYHLHLGRGYELMASADLAASDRFGGAVAIDEGLAVVGVEQDDDSGGASGSAYIFDSYSGQTHKLRSLTGAGSELFGSSVAIDGSNVIVGSRLDNDGGFSAGSAFVFHAGTGLQQRQLLPGDLEGLDNFGISVGVSGDIVVVGADQDDDLGSQSGSAYLFSASTGQQLHKLLPDDGVAGDRFGSSVAIDDGLVLVGSPQRDAVANNSGAAYIYDAATGQQLHRLIPEDAAYGDRFGSAVAISGSIALVSALEEDTNGTEAGAAYLFDAATGQQLHKLLADTQQNFAYFGRSVALNGETALVGASHASGTQGAAYVFDTGTGSLVARLEPTSGLSENDYFGWAVGLSGCLAIVGAREADLVGTDSGAAFLFDIPTGGLSSVPLPGSSLARRLEPPFPNPFNPRTRLRFDLARAGHAHLAVYDVAGRLVATLVDDDLAAGRHEFTWQGDDMRGRRVGSGMYLARLVTAAGVESHKLTLLE